MARGTGAPNRSPRKKRYPIEHYDRCSVMLISMVPTSEIEKQLSMSWGKPRAYVRTLITHIHRDWEEGAALTQNTRRHQIRQGFEALFMKCITKGDLQTAKGILTELGRLDGCYLPDRVAVEHSGGVGVGISLGSLGFKSPQEVAERVEWLQAQIAARGMQALAGNQPQLVAQAHLAGETPDNHTNGAQLPDPDNVIDILPDNEEGGAS